MKDIIIIAKKMELGGTEVSLLNTIYELEKYDVKITLGLMKKQGILLDKIPKNVKVIEIINDVQNKYFEKLSFNYPLKVFIKVFLAKVLKKKKI